MLRLLTLCLVLWGTTTRADERFMPYIDWIVEHSELEYHGQPLPDVEIVSPALLEILVFGELTVARAEQSGNTLPTVLGSYDHERNVMMFPDDVDPWTQEDVLVHELYHYLQYANYGDTDCVQKYERPAYKAHWQWVEDHGLTEQYEEPNWLFVYMLEMACNPEYRNR